MAFHDKSQSLARCGETYGPPWWRGRLMAQARWWRWGFVRGGGGVGGCQQAWTGVTPRQALLGPHQQNAGCQATHWNRGELLVSLLPLSTNFLARWSWSNPSGPAHSDALCHSIKQNVLLVSRHVKEVTGKVNLTLNSFSDVLIKKTNQMSEIKWHKVDDGLMADKLRVSFNDGETICG